MSAGFPISRELKTVTTPNGNDRLARALELANAFAFHVRLDLDLNAEAFADQYQKQLKDLLGDVNEFITVDITKATQLFRKLIRIRYDLVNGGMEPGLIAAAMNSETASDNLLEGEFAMAQHLTSTSDFVRRQGVLQKLLVEFYPQ